MSIKNTDILEIFKETKNSGGKVALAVEGGGLRGVVSATMLKVFEDLGLAGQIDAVAGTSAGAINLAYFLNNNMKLGLELYKTLASKNFIQPSKWPNAMNFKYLFDEQIPNHFNINWGHLRQHSTDFHISMTDLKTGQGHFIKSQETANDDELIKSIRASSSAPLFTTNKELIGNSYYNDGQVQHSIPIQPLINGNYDVIFCLLTRKNGYRKSSSILNSILTSFALRKYSTAYKSEFSKTAYSYNKILDKIFNSTFPKIIPLCLTEEDYIISKTCTSPKDMQRCIDSTLARFT